MKFSERAEEIVLDILNRNNTNKTWTLFENIVQGVRKAQYVEYQPPYKISYPDYEGKNSDGLVMLVEVKSHDMGFFDQRHRTLAITRKHFNHYLKVASMESVPVQIVFVVRHKNHSIEFFWQDILKLRKAKFYIEKYAWRYKIKGVIQESVVDTIFWSTEYFRTDIENLGV